MDLGAQLHLFELRMTLGELEAVTRLTCAGTSTSFPPIVFGRGASAAEQCRQLLTARNAALPPKRE